MTQAEVEPAEIDVLIWASALSETHVQNPDSVRQTPIEELLGGFHYRASWLQEELHLDNARVTAVAQQGCAGMFSALSTAHALLASDPSLRNILCVGVDALPEGAPREILYNLISDAGCAVVLSRENLQCRWRSFHQVSKGYYWNIVEKQKEIIASYFPTSRAVIRELLSKAGIGADRRSLDSSYRGKQEQLGHPRQYRFAGSEQDLSGSSQLRSHHRSRQSSASRILARIEEGSPRRPVAPFHLRVRLHLVRSHFGESMSEHIVLTGATGAIGLPLAARLLSRPTLERLTAIVRSSSRCGDIACDPQEPQSRQRILLS